MLLILFQCTMDEIQVLVTEASSPVAYHLLYLLASGDILPQRVMNYIQSISVRINTGYLFGAVTRK